MRRHLWLPALLTCAVACDCGTSVEDLAVEGSERWYRCAEWPSPDRSIEGVGEVADRVLAVDGVTRLEVFALGEGGDDWLRAQEPCSERCAQLVLGGVSRDEGLRAALGARGRTLVLAGGEDTIEELEDLEDTAGLADLRGLERVRVGGHDFVPVHGGSQPWARRVGACGFDAEDVSELELENTWLISWMAPRGAGFDPIDTGVFGVHLGDESLADAIAEQAPLGGIFAYPRSADARSGGDAPAVIAPIAGGLHESPRLGRVIGTPVVLELGSDGWVVAESTSDGLVGSE